jgi:hypothetical protein
LAVRWMRSATCVGQARARWRGSQGVVSRQDSNRPLAVGQGFTPSLTDRPSFLSCQADRTSCLVEPQTRHPRRETFPVNRRVEGSNPSREADGRLQNFGTRWLTETAGKLLSRLCSFLPTFRGFRKSCLFGRTLGFAESDSGCECNRQGYVRTPNLSLRNSQTLTQRSTLRLTQRVVPRPGSWALLPEKMLVAIETVPSLEVWLNCS